MISIFGVWRSTRVVYADILSCEHTSTCWLCANVMPVADISASTPIVISSSCSVFAGPVMLKRTLEVII